MKEIDQLNQAKYILNNVLSASFYSLNNNKLIVQEARSHVRQAIDKLEKLAKKEAKKEAQKEINKPKPNTPTVSQDWIQNLDTYYKVGTVGLKKLEEMIQSEKDKLNELEKKSQTINNNEKDEMIID